MSDSRAIRLLLVDDQELFVQSLRYVLESRAPDIEIVDVARDGQDAIDKATKCEPDVILMDVRMPGMDGVSAMRVIHELQPDVKVLMLSTFGDDELVRQSMRYGAIGYVVKNMTPEELVHSVRAVMNGTMQISPAVAPAILRKEAVPSGRPAGEHAFALAALTRREKEVLSLIAAGHDNRGIAEYLNLTEQTTRNYVHNLYSKLGVSSRLQLMRLLNEAER